MVFLGFVSSRIVRVGIVIKEVDGIRLWVLVS